MRNNGHSPGAAGSAHSRLYDILQGSAVPRLPLVDGPTPLEQRDDIGSDLGIRVFLKREDKADDLGCGHKLRKLSYLMADALALGSDVLVTAGSLPSNQCKAVAAWAPRHNLRAHLVFGGDHQYRPPVAHGNYLLTSLLLATVTWHERSPWSSIDRLLGEAAEAERRNGSCPYVIGSGASQWPGLLGSVELGFEMAAQLDAKDVDSCHLVAVAGSGGTCLGLAIAAGVLGRSWAVTGVCVAEGAAQVMQRCRAMQADFARRTGLAVPIEGILDFTEAARGNGYDLPTPQELEAVAMAVRRYGLLLDPNYMIKAYLGLRSLVASSLLRADSAVLIHSGGQFGVFDSGGAWVRWHRSTYWPQLACDNTLPTSQGMPATGAVDRGF